MIVNKYACLHLPYNPHHQDSGWLPGKYANNFCSKNMVMRFERRINQTSNILQRFYETYKPSNCVKYDYEIICILVLLRDISKPPGHIRPKKLVFTCYVNEGCERSTSQNPRVAGKVWAGGQMKSNLCLKKELFNLIFCINSSAIIHSISSK